MITGYADSNKLVSFEQADMQARAYKTWCKNNHLLSYCYR